MQKFLTLSILIELTQKGSLSHDFVCYSNLIALE